MPSGAELFVQSIKTLGISRIFTLLGDHLNEVLAVAPRGGAEILDMRPAARVEATEAPDASDVRQVLKLLRSAGKPVVLAGSGVWWADAAAELREFIERTSLPLYTITMAKGAVSDEHPLCMGYADPALNQAVRVAFQEADLFLVLGKRIDYRLALGGARLFSAGAKFIQVDIHAPELGMNRKLELGICGDVRETLRAMLAAIGDKPWTPLP